MICFRSRCYRNTPGKRALTPCRPPATGRGCRAPVCPRTRGPVHRSSESPLGSGERLERGTQSEEENVNHRERLGSSLSVFVLFSIFGPEMPLLRCMADMTPTEKAMFTDRYWPFDSLLVFTCAAAEQPKSFRRDARGQKRGGIDCAF